MGVRNLDNKGFTIIPILSHILREPQIHDCIVCGRRLCRLLLSHAIFRFNLSVHAGRFELDNRCQALLRQYRSWCDNHCRLECPD